MTDKTIFDDHKAFAKTNDSSIVFLYMRAYFAHLINGVSRRYINSLVNDPDLRLYIRLSNYLFLTVSLKTF